MKFFADRSLFPMAIILLVAALVLNFHYSVRTSSIEEIQSDDLIVCQPLGGPVCVYFQVDQDTSLVILEYYDVCGESVECLIMLCDSGCYGQVFPILEQPSGIYFCVLYVAGRLTDVKKLLYLADRVDESLEEVAPNPTRREWS